MKQRVLSMVFVGAMVVSQVLGGMRAEAEVVSLNGAGATFPYPIYSKWFSEYRKANPKAEINYQSIGSGGGIRQLLEKTVDFGASDAPMTDEQLKKADPAVIHIPTVLGAVVLIYNVPGVPAGVKFNPEVLADIFMGKITKWSDPKIAALNPGVKFPEKLSVIVAHRSDGSGTTAIFTDYLSKVSPAWKERVGAGTAVKWPTGLGGKGNEGVTGVVKQTPGAIGYVELVYAESNRLTVASVQNAEGQFIQPSVKTLTAAAAGVMKTMPADFRISITNAQGKESYPIAGFTYLLIYNEMKGAKAEVLKGFIQWALSEGQKMASTLGYGTLPAELSQKALARLKEIKSR